MMPRPRFFKVNRGLDHGRRLSSGISIKTGAIPDLAALPRSAAL
jgi:hypothetical protein